MLQFSCSFLSSSEHFLWNNFISFLFNLFLASSCSTWDLLVPPPGIKPVPLAVRVQSLNHWTITEVPDFVFFFKKNHDYRGQLRRERNHPWNNKHEVLVFSVGGVEEKWVIALVHLTSGLQLLSNHSCENMSYCFFSICFIIFPIRNCRLAKFQVYIFTTFFF